MTIGDRGKRRAARGWLCVLGVVDTANLLRAAGAMHGGLAAAVGATSTGGHGFYRSSQSEKCRYAGKACPCNKFHGCTFRTT